MARIHFFILAAFYRHCEPCLQGVAKQGEAAASLVIHFLRFVFMDCFSPKGLRNDGKRALSLREVVRLRGNLVHFCHCERSEAIH
ncbi:hypothetical protein [Helicobacter canis]|uniref:hypothetical protein n=1 Tax=Helicobacter canis TaxID=29419 RepID=UPI00042805E2|nr:hypothetical protein [Helicobacter canis]